MRRYPGSIVFIFLTLCITTTSFSKNRVFLFVAKSKTDVNFITAYKGAKAEADQFGDTLIFAGSDGKAHFRTQDASIARALESHPIDGIAISVLNEAYLVQRSFKTVLERKIPVLTYDSDFEQHKTLRAGYVGTDNAQFGYTLGTQAITIRPQGGVAVIIGESQFTPNINSRISGIRKAFHDRNEMLRKAGKTEGGWSEHVRSPWYCKADNDRALRQLVFSLEHDAIDVIISAGWWPQMAKDYPEAVRPFKGDLSDKRKVIICADAAPTQLEYLREGISIVNVGQDFAGMGRLSYRLMVKLAEKETIPEYNFTPGKIFTRGDE